MAGIWRLVFGSLAILAALAMSGSATQNSIEMQVIVDQWVQIPGLKKAEIKRMVESIVKGVNSIFKNLKSSGVDFNVRIADIDIIQNEQILPHLGNGRADSENVTYDFKAWLDGKSYKKTDHTMLLTGMDLVKGSNTDPAGKATLSGMCTDSSLSVVEFKPNGIAIRVMAHELGHSLSADHDTNNCDDHYIMATKTQSTKSTNIFRFSSCSIDYFTTFLEQLEKKGNCLSRDNTTLPPLSAQPLGEIYTPDDICRMTYGSHSYFCRGFYGDGADLTYSDSCSLLYCSTEGSFCNKTSGIDGFACGRKDTCPYGDSLKEFDNGNCTATSSKSPMFCYNDFFRMSCCNSCLSHYTGIPGCEYGDTTGGCNNPYHCAEYGTNKCCYTCRNPAPGI